MIFRHKEILVMAAVAVVCGACKNNTAKNHGPIVLGDSASIVTEKDPRKLSDLVTDLQPDIPPAANPDSIAKAQAAQNKPADSAKDGAAKARPAQGEDQSLPDVAGLKAEFKELTVLVPGITAKISGNTNLKNANSAVYTLLSGSLEGGSLHLKGSVTKVTQKCQSVVVIKNKLGSLPLESLTETSDFEAVKVEKNVYVIKNIDGNSLDVPTANNSVIRNAVIKAANKRRLSHKKLQEWLTSVGSVRTANQKPLVVTLRSVIWKIDGKDENGKAFSKQIRIDIPL
jgi:hypothetical protein